MTAPFSSKDIFDALDRLKDSMPTDEIPDRTWGLDFDADTAAFLPRLGKELDERCQSVRAIYDAGTINTLYFNNLLGHVLETSQKLWRDYCVRKYPGVRDGD